MLERFMQWYWQRQAVKQYEKELRIGWEAAKRRHQERQLHH